MNIKNKVYCLYAFNVAVLIIGFFISDDIIRLITTALSIALSGIVTHKYCSYRNSLNEYTEAINTSGNETIFESPEISKKIEYRAEDIAKEQSSCTDIKKLKNTVYFLGFSQKLLLLNYGIARQCTLLHKIQEGLWTGFYFTFYFLPLTIFIILGKTLQSDMHIMFNILLPIISIVLCGCYYIYLSTYLSSASNKENENTKSLQEKRQQREENNPIFFEDSYFVNQREEIHYVMDIYENGWYYMGDKFNKETIYIQVAYFFISILLFCLFVALL